MHAPTHSFQGPGPTAAATATIAALLQALSNRLRDQPGIDRGPAYAAVLDLVARDLLVGDGHLFEDLPAGRQAKKEPIPVLNHHAGNRLDEQLRHRHLSKTELARRLGISRYGLHKLASGQSRPGYDLAMALARELAVPVEWLFPPKV